jgi:hypothetical protein
MLADIMETTDLNDQLQDDLEPPSSYHKPHGKEKYQP